jgi:hypothetical protein
LIGVHRRSSAAKPSSPTSKPVFYIHLPFIAGIAGKCQNDTLGRAVSFGIFEGFPDLNLTRSDGRAL